MKTTAKSLLKKKVPYILIPGLLVAFTLGWKFNPLEKIENYYRLKQLFPATAVVKQIEDGDTFVLRNDIKVRLIGIDAPPGNLTGSQNYLVETILNKKIYLEYDRYQDDKYGRTLAWVWMDCESTPKFLAADYMHKSNNQSMPGLTANPEGCKKGKLVQEELIKQGFAEVVIYKDRGELKYESRINNVSH